MSIFVARSQLTINRHLGDFPKRKSSSLSSLFIHSYLCNGLVRIIGYTIAK